MSSAIFCVPSTARAGPPSALTSEATSSSLTGRP